MIKQVKIQLSMENTVKKPSSHWAYLLYSILMEKIDPTFAYLLHEQGIKPINHYLEVQSQGERQQLIWVVNMLGEETVEKISAVLEGTRQYVINKYEAELQVTDIKTEALITERELVEKYLINQEPAWKLNIFHVTPCSFKTNEQYAIFPSVELIIKSAVQKWNAFARETIIDDPDALGQIINYTRIGGYQLKSSGYMLKDNVIPAFIGRTSLTVRGPEPLLRLTNLLINYLSYSGLGIKSSLGMGGCRIS